jgi:hypothetical protein
MRILSNTQSHEYLSLAIGLSVLTHGVLLAILAGGGQDSDSDVIVPDPTLQLLRFSTNEGASLYLDPANSFKKSSSSTSFSKAVSPLHPPPEEDARAPEINPETHASSASIEPSTNEKAVDTSHFSFENMPAFPLGAKGASGWGLAPLSPDLTERLPREALATQQHQMRLAKQRKMVLTYLDKIQEDISMRQPPSFCVVTFDSSWQKAWLKCAKAQDEAMVYQQLMKANVTASSVALPTGNCTVIGQEKPPPELECQ